MKYQLGLALFALVSASSASAATAESVIPHYNVAKPDRVLVREADGCKLILPDVYHTGETWRDTGRAKPVRCVNGLAEASEQYSITRIGADGNPVGTSTGRIISGGLPYQKTRPEFKPVARVNLRGNQVLLFKTGSDQSINSTFYMAVRFWTDGWNYCPDEVIAVVETPDETPFVQQVGIEGYVNGALETSGLACPAMKKLMLFVVADIKQIGASEANLIYTAAYYQAPKGWFPNQWERAQNHAFNRAERKRVEADRVAKLEAEKRAWEERMQAERAQREQQMKLSQAVASYKSAAAATSDLDRLAALLPPKKATNQFSYTLSKPSLTDPITLIAHAKNTGQKQPFAFPAEVSSVNAGQVELKWPAPFKGSATETANVSSPGWYLLMGQFTADAGAGVKGTIEIDWAYQCKLPKCKDDAADMAAEIYSIQHFRKHIEASQK